MISYRLSYTSALSHVVDISIIVSGNKQQRLFFQLPAWRPGRYELQHFAQKLSAVTAHANGQRLPISKQTKDRWQVDTNGAETVTINYSFYARQMDAGGSWLDEQMLYINPVNCLMAVEGREDEACQLQLSLLPNWKITCGLPETENHTLLAANYDELADSPFIASPTLKKTGFEVAGTTFTIWLQGDCQPDWQKITADFKAFTEEQFAVFGDFPVPAFHYLNIILPYKFYHGVEHSHSTVITLGPGELLMSSGLYKEFLGVSSHELFHAWNIKKIRPAEMLPYNFAQENYFKTGYVAEGITTYYGDYMLARAGVFTAAQYFDELNTTLQRYFADYSRNNLSLADSSFDLWLDGYKPGIPDRKVSIYVKGALTALLLDLLLRQQTGNAKSLDDVMRALWEKHGKTGTGYTEEDYATIVSEIAGQPFDAYFDKYINGTAPLEHALNQALQFVGCNLTATENPIINESKYGFKIVTEGSAKVSAVAPDSPASMALSIDDELIAVNGTKIENNLQQLLEQQENPIELTLFRNRQIRSVQLQASTATFYGKHTIQKRTDATEAERQNFKVWLKQEF